ncbi:MAG TPA: GxxExxY protein [Pirellulaceae bacterium]|nr:GxxExxY protein [Pirellulaceae bacterium]
MTEKENRDPKTYAIIGAAMEVHRVLGCGFSEPVYQQAMQVELMLRGIPAQPQLELPVIYKGHTLECTYKPDFICYGDILVELKALSLLSGTEEAQVLNYLKVSKNPVGLLINFGLPSLEFRRFILSQIQPNPSP